MKNKIINTHHTPINNLDIIKERYSTNKKIQDLLERHDLEDHEYQRIQIENKIVEAINEVEDKVNNILNNFK